MTEAVNPQASILLSPDEGETVWLRKLGIRFLIGGEQTKGNFSLVEHPIVPRGLAAPMHIHRREDEFSFVLEGRWGFQLGSDVVYAEPGDLVYKPRDVWHTFWNATDTPARLLEIISPAGFEQLFVELDSSLENRKELARELGYTGDTGDSAAMNIWLHKRVMKELAAHGGKVPANMLD